MVMNISCFLAPSFFEPATMYTYINIHNTYKSWPCRLKCLEKAQGFFGWGFPTNKIDEHFGPNSELYRIHINVKKPVHRQHLVLIHARIKVV